MFVAILLLKDSKRDFLENNKGEVTGPEGIESSCVCSAKPLEEGLSGDVTDDTVMVAVDDTDRATGIGRRCGNFIRQHSGGWHRKGGGWWCRRRYSNGGGW